MSGHESIWLEPEDGSDPDTGRMWCQHPAPGLHDDRTWTEYVRADLVAAREAAAFQRGAEAMRERAAQSVLLTQIDEPLAHYHVEMEKRDVSIAAAIRARMEKGA